MRLRWNRPLKAGVAILVLGTGPLLLYILFGPSDGNPIGLGLLFFFSAPFGVAFTAWGGLLLWMGKRHPGGTSSKSASFRRPGNHRDDWNA